MRTIRFFAWAAALSAGGAGVAACADSVHLDPPGGTGGHSSTTTAHGGGGGVAAECRSNPDCSYPTAVCDTVAQRCVECLVQADCGAKPGTVCSQGVCGCAQTADAAALSYCPTLGNQGPRCVDTQTSESDCGSCGHSCFGACAAGKCADKWTKISSVGAPAGRSHHVAAWTGTRMFVWGGNTAGGATNTGGLYDPVANAWTTVSLVDAPTARTGATAAWDPVEKVVIVWGGVGASGTELGTGAMYHPDSDTWTPMANDNAPAARFAHTAVWATFDTNAPFLGAVGHGMLVWGGNDKVGHLSDGMVFDPATNSWAGPLDSGGPTARGEHAAAWDTQNFQLIVFGGYGKNGPVDSYLGDGAVFTPGNNTWAGLNTAGSPSARARHTAVWDPTGHAMYVTGGADNTGQFGDITRYASGSWQSPASSALPDGREGHSAVWVDTASAMVVFGGANTAGYLNSGFSVGSSLVWKALPTAPSARAHHSAVTDGTKVFVWGGDGPGGALLADGATFDAAP